MPETDCRRRAVAVGGFAARSLLLTGLGVAACLGLGRPAAADWLVLNDGSRVETSGPWTTKGRLVIFKTAAGTLSSLRLDEVDLGASERATREATEKPAEVKAPSAPKRPPALVLTDADIPRAAVVAGEEAEDGSNGSTGEATDGTGAAASGVEVTAWQQVPAPDGGGVQVFGTVENTTNLTASDLEVTVSLHDSAGKVLDTHEAVIGRKALAPGARANFSVAFPGVFGATDATFETRYRGFEPRASPAPAGAGTEDAEGASAPAQPESPGGG